MYSPKTLQIIREALGPHRIAANAIILYEATREKIILWRNVITAQATHVQVAVFQLSVHVIDTNNVNDDHSFQHLQQRHLFNRFSL